MKKQIQYTILALTISFIGFSQNKFVNPKLEKLTNQTLSKTLFLGNPKLEIIKGENDLPIFIKGKIANQKAIKQARGTIATAVFGYLETIKETLKIDNPENEFEIGKTITNNDNEQHIRLNQSYKGIPVFGGELIVHLKNNETEMVNGRYFKTPKIEDISANIDPQSAFKLAMNDVSKKSIVKDYSILEKKILNHKEAKPELIIYHPNDETEEEVLAYRIEVRPNLVERWEYFIEAKTGAVINKYNTTCALDGPVTATASDLNGISRSINTYQIGNSYALIDTKRTMFPGGAVNSDDPQGVLWTIDAEGTTGEDMKVSQIVSSNNTWLSKTAVSAHYNAGIAYEYYRTTHARNSLNGKGGTIVSIINIKENDKNTGLPVQMDNAFWNGEFMGYGNGKDFFKPLAGGLDVAGHEMTHGVIENTANLNYQGQSGAINESMADVFGVLIDRADGDWVVGEDVMKAGSGKSFLRSLSDPNKGDQPADMTEIYRGTEDNGGVHINSGIPNRVFYLFTSALTGSENEKKNKAEKVYYKALTTYLTRSSKFTDLRAAIVQSCKDLVGTVGADAVAAAENAFAIVGIGGATGTTTQPTQKPVEDLPANIGAEFILSYDPCEKAIYSSKEIVNSSADYRVVVPNVVIQHKPSVTDDGSFAYYISKIGVTDLGGTLNRVNLIGTAKVEVLSSEKIWRNVSVSKDGLKLAAVTIPTDDGDEKNILIFDLKTNTSKANKLYNPTYSQNVKTAGSPLYADALEWDYGGEYLIYDAYNEIKTTGIVAAEPTSSIDYWDVGILKAWDNSKATFGDGNINKIFSNLAKNESIGNPSFAKKSTSVLAFDRLFNNKNSIITIDFEAKGTDGSYKRAEIANNTIGFPEFSAKDDKLIFNRLSIASRSKECTNDTTNTASISITADKVTPTGSINLDFVQKSALAVWYTIGKRALPTKQNQVITVPPSSVNTEGNPVSINLTEKTDKGTIISYKIISGPASISGGKIVPTGKPGKVKVQANAIGTDALNASETIFEFCVNPVKPTISKTVSGSTTKMTSSSDLTNIWFKDGVSLNQTAKAVDVTAPGSYTVQSSIDGCVSAMSEKVKIDAVEQQAQTISTVSIASKNEGDKTVFTMPEKTDKGNIVIYTIVSGPATITNNKLELTGRPGRVKVKGSSTATTEYTAATDVNYDFCVNPKKPTITIIENPSDNIFRSSSTTGNNWYKDGVLLPAATGQEISVISASSFKVQINIEECKSEFSDARSAAAKLLAEELSEKDSILVYPSPIIDFLTLKLGNNVKVDNVTINNILGAEVISKNYIRSGNEIILDLKALPKGLYVLKVKTEKAILSKKILKE